MSELERDRQLDAAWRVASRDEPPLALDSAIRAAARREVGAGPAGTSAARRWWPLAAAAAVAAVAIGIVQLAPPERVAPTTITDLSSAPRDASDNAGPEPGSEQPASPATPRAAAARAPQASDRAIELEHRAGRARNSAAPTAASRQAPTPEPPTASKAPSDSVAEAQSASQQAGARVAGALGARDAAPAARQLAPSGPGAGEAVKPPPAPARTVDAWIALIRRLLADGRRDEAAKELAAFRIAYKERADALLPADLRAMKP